jgi:hypothetical protein
MEITNRGTVRSAQADACFFVGEAEKSARPCRNCANFSFSMTRLPLSTVGGSHNYGTCYSHFIDPPLVSFRKIDIKRKLLDNFSGT